MAHREQKERDWRTLVTVTMRKPICVSSGTVIEVLNASKKLSETLLRSEKKACLESPLVAEISDRVKGLIGVVHYAKVSPARFEVERSLESPFMHFHTPDTIRHLADKKAIRNCAPGRGFDYIPTGCANFVTFLHTATKIRVVVRHFDMEDKDIRSSERLAGGQLVASASEPNNTWRVRELLDEGVDINSVVERQNGVVLTPILAAVGVDLETALLLLERGANPFIEREKGVNILNQYWNKVDDRHTFNRAALRMHPKLAKRSAEEVLAT